MIEPAAALLLFASSLTAWLVASGARPAARVHLRFAAVLFAALAASVFAVAPAVPAIALLVLPIGSGVLVLATLAATARSPEAALAASLLAGVSLAALGASVTGWTALALAPSALCAGAIGLLAAKGRDRLGVVQGIAAALCLLGACSAFALEGADAALTLFCAAALLGLALSLSRSDPAVDERAGRDLRTAIGRGRAR